VFDALGSGFTLLVLGEDSSAGTADAKEQWVRAAREAAEQQRMPLTVVREPSGAVRDAYGAPLVLVRPDEFVAWAGSAADESADRVISKARGA
jgi:hypothetical protein